VGAPKCGTTSLYTYLGQHPRIYVPAALLKSQGKSEPCHFATDLLPENDPWRSDQYYLGFFREAGADQISGDASVWHLLSETAAANIRDFNPDAKIIIMIRNPVDLVESLHSQMVYNGVEPLADLRTALDAEASRRDGENVPGGLRFAELLHYRHIVRLSSQVMRYQACFPEDQVHIIVFDDFVRNTPREHTKVLRFLDVDPGACNVDFKVVNPRKEVRSRAVRRLAKRPPMPLRAIGRFLLPRRMRSAVRRRMIAADERFNTAYRSTKPVDTSLKDELRIEFEPEIRRLGEIVGRDLSDWTKQPQ